MAQGRLDEAVALAGGVAQVFSKNGESSFEELVSAKISGNVSSGGEWYSYKYEFSIKFDSLNQDVSYKRQLLEIKKNIDSGFAHYLSISFDEDGVDFSPSKKLEREMKWVAKEITSLNSTGFFAGYMLTNILRHSGEVVALVARDFSGRFVLNVVPSNVKKQEDSSRRPGIGTDGSGLASTLYAIKRGRRFYDDSVGQFEHPERIDVEWNSVLKLIQVAVPSIHGIDVISDPFENLLRTKFTIGDGYGKSVQPITALSDGTVKWISLILRLCTSRAALLLEEPENYLHPLMQREIVRLLRSSVVDNGFVIVSTHSETLLNAVNASEVVVVSFKDGSTRACRVSNQEDVSAEINETGFGLGYYYLTDSLEVE